MKKTEIAATTAIFASAVILTGVLATASIDAAPPSRPEAASAFAKASTSAKATADKPADKSADRVVRGKYLVDIMGCHDCHTPGRSARTVPR